MHPKLSFKEQFLAWELWLDASFFWRESCVFCRCGFSFFYNILQVLIQISLIKLSNFIPVLTWDSAIHLVLPHKNPHGEVLKTQEPIYRIKKNSRENFQLSFWHSPLSTLHFSAGQLAPAFFLGDRLLSWESFCLLELPTTKTITKAGTVLSLLSFLIPEAWVVRINSLIPCGKLLPRVLAGVI